MDAKSKANFINSVAKGKTIVCPKCNTENKPHAKFCVACGTKLIKIAEEKDTPVFSPISEETIVPKEKYVEARSVFAEGLPSWDIVPPQVMVRRR